jgi:hypothetical protein
MFSCLYVYGDIIMAESSLTEGGRRLKILKRILVCKRDELTMK